MESRQNTMTAEEARKQYQELYDKKEKVEDYIEVIQYHIQQDLVSIEDSCKYRLSSLVEIKSPYIKDQLEELGYEVVPSFTIGERPVDDKYFIYF